MCRSMKPLARGYPGDEVVCLMPKPEREIWQTPCSGTEVRCLILSRLDTLQLKRDRLDGPLMTRMMFWLCKGREISRNNHRSRHMSCHRRRNNPYPVSSKGPLECHEARGAPWVPETFDTFLASFGVIFYVRIDSCPVHMLFGIFLYLVC